MIWRILICLFFGISFCHGQQESLVFKNGIEKPNTTTSHHFGLFHLRINQNFKERPIDRTTFSFTIESGNNFHPWVEMYLPKDPTIRETFGQTDWYSRKFDFLDQETTPAEYSNIHVDAVFKVFRIDIETKLSRNMDLKITARTFMPTEGNFPFTFFTNDQSIEWFHTNIAGGEDPFGRRFFGMNQMTFSYLDRNGRSVNLKNNQFIFSGIELNQHYYPQLFKEEKGMYTSFGSHLGINTTQYNSSLDIGFSANIHKKWILKNKNEFRLGLGLAALRKGFVKFNSPVDFGNNLYLGSGEINFEFTKYTRKGNYHSFAGNYQLQTQYNKDIEESYYYLNGNDTWQLIHSGWQNGIEMLYQPLSVYSIFYTYGRKKMRLSLYVMQDFKLNNAPDLQTGIKLGIPLTIN